MRYPFTWKSDQIIETKTYLDIEREGQETRRLDLQLALLEVMSRSYPGHCHHQPPCIRLYSPKRQSGVMIFFFFCTLTGLRGCRNLSNPLLAPAYPIENSFVNLAIRRR